MPPAISPVSSAMQLQEPLTIRSSNCTYQVDFPAVALLASWQPQPGGKDATGSPVWGADGAQQLRARVQQRQPPPQEVRSMRE